MDKTTKFSPVKILVTILAIVLVPFAFSQQKQATTKQSKISPEFWQAEEGLALSKKKTNEAKVAEPKLKPAIKAKTQKIKTDTKKPSPPVAPAPVAVTPPPVVVKVPPPAPILPPPQPSAPVSLVKSDFTVIGEGSIPMDIHSPNPQLNKAAISSRTATYPMDLQRVWTANKNLPVIIQNAISSQAAGKIVATVQENLYGGNLDLILVPKGSQAFGFYRSNLRPGDEVLNVNWYRIITPPPNSYYIDFGEDAALADISGQAGIGGDVDKRYVERFVNVMLFSSIQYGLIKNLPSDTTADSLAVQQASANVANLSAEILRDSLGLAPIVRIPAGAIAQISPSKDIYFPPPNDGKITVEPLKETP